MSARILLGDLSNGAYLKLALAEPGHRPGVPGLYACDSYQAFEHALLDFLADNGQPDLLGAGFSTSGWKVDGHIDLVHYGFTIERHALGALLGARRINMVNDFVAKALAVPTLEDDERVKVCGGVATPGSVIAVIGPTAGLGCAFLAPDGHGGWTATHCEGGHSDFAPGNLQELEILRLMMQTYGHVSCERGVSAPGLIELWRCLCLLEGERPSEPAVEEILALAHAQDRRARDVIRIQTELLAGVASDIALTVGATGGVYLAGSHLDSLGSLFDHDPFARRFYDKGRVSSYVRDIPVYRMTASEPEILGLSTLFD